MVSPVVIGGMSGSGTRVYAQVIQRLGVYIGDGECMNGSYDNLEANKLFNGGHARETVDSYDLTAERCKTLETMMVDKAAGRRWGWKLPESYFYLPHMLRYWPKMRYIHVMRHGLDMAFKPHQTQHRSWGWRVGIDGEVTKASRLELWIRANRLVDEVAGPDTRVSFMRFERLCEMPHAEALRLASSIDLVVEYSKINKVVEIVKPPASLGRWKGKNLSVFSADQLKAVASFGYSCKEPGDGTERSVA